MKILFDQGTPKPLRSYLRDHDVITAHQMGWSTLRNGELLSAAEAACFNLFVTTDRNLRYQQNLTSRTIAIVVLGSGQWPRIEASVESVIVAVRRASIGTYEEVALC
jgi:hypothetical protein